MSKDLEYSLLLDFYSFSLTDKQKNVLDMYYNEDMSLSEIASEVNITRQAALDFIKRGNVKLSMMEKELGLFEKFNVVTSTLAETKDYILKMKKSDNEIIDKIDNALRIWEDKDGV